MRIKKIGILPLGKMLGALYAVMGLVLGGIMSIVALLGSAFTEGAAAGGAMFGLLFGAGAIVALPVFYGVMGFLVGLFTAFLYNILASFLGGIELEVE